MKGLLFCFVVIFSVSAAQSKCPDFEEHLIWVPKDKIEAKEDLMKKAKSLNDSGQCIVEGGFGRQSGKFYITVSSTGKPAGAKILKFSRKEL